MGGPEEPVGAGASADAFPWMVVAIAAVVLLAVVAAFIAAVRLLKKNEMRTTPPVVALASFIALVLAATVLYFATDLFRSGDTGDTGDSGGPGSGTTLAGWYTRQDLADPSLGSAWYFDSATGIATYYAYWEPGTCDFSEPGSGSYAVVGGELILADTWQATLSGDGRSFVLDEPGQWSGDSSEGVAGPNMTVMNGISGTYVASSDCAAP